MLGTRLSRPLHLPAHSSPTVQMTTTHQGAVAHLVEEEGEEASIPLADWYSEREMLQKPIRTVSKGGLGCLIQEPERSYHKCAYNLIKTALK